MTYNERVNELAEKMARAANHNEWWNKASDKELIHEVNMKVPLAKVAIEFAKEMAETMYMQAERDGIEISITKQEPKSIYQHLTTLGLTE